MSDQNGAEPQTPPDELPIALAQDPESRSRGPLYDARRSVLQGGGWVEIPNLRDEAARKEWENDRYSCKPGTPDEFLLPNRSWTKTTVLPSSEALAQLRQRQQAEPYHAAMYHDWGGERK